MNCIVVVPIHRDKLTINEELSLKRLMLVLSNWKLVILCPRQNKNVDFYGLEKIVVNSFWMSDLKSYNKLKKSKFFYKHFGSYKFILTYELDAYVFRDELDMWCSKGYDYIGAPWFDGFTQADLNSEIIGVGNSGFSLRKVSLKDKINEYIQPPKIYFSKNYVLMFLGFLVFLFFKVLRKFNLNNSVFLFNNDPEDIFYGYRLKEKGIQINIAPISEAIKFSFEINPRKLFRINNNELPFGCHAWWKYDFDFWKGHVNYEN